MLAERRSPTATLAWIFAFIAIPFVSGIYYMMFGPRRLVRRAHPAAGAGQVARRRAAEINIRRRGLDLGAVAQLQIAGAPSDQVLSQSPLPNASGVSAPKISLLVTSASEAQALVMPNFVGQPLASAAQVLQGAGLRVGVVTFAGQPGSPFSPPLITTPQASANSTIVSHNPAAGEKVIADSAVNFQVK